MPLAPPPNGAIFPTWADCLQTVQSLAAQEGYAVNSKGQAKNKETGLYRRYVIRCDKSGTFKSAAQIGRRRNSTKKTNCPFSAACNIRPDGCHLKVLCPDHNHPASAVPGAHVQHRKFTDEQRRLVEARAVERKSIKTIWDELKTLDPNTHITFKDVDNAVQRFRKKAKEGATGVQAVMYKLVERQDVFCFTLEKDDGDLQGIFWVPRWSTDAWVNPNGAPGILVMLTDHIANKPVLPTLEMHGALTTTSFGSAPAGPIMPNNPGVIANPADAPLPIHPDLADNNNIHNPNGTSIPNPAHPTEPAQGAQVGTVLGNNGFEPSPGTGYAILPDKSNATMLWLHSAVELLRQRIPRCPKPRFLMLTDYQTKEKSILIEVAKGAPPHLQSHIVFGRVLTRDNVGSPVGYTASTGATQGGVGAGGNGGPAPNPTATQGIEPQGGDGEEEEEEEEEDTGMQEAEGVDESDEEEEDNESPADQDLDGDHDSDAEIARQLTGGLVHNGQSQQPMYAQSQMPGYGYQPAVNGHQQQAQHSNSAPSSNTAAAQPSTPAPGQDSAQAQPAAHMGFSPLMPGNGMSNGTMPRQQ